MASVGRGITNKQASYLAALARELHVPYPGSGMTRLEASLTIADYQRQVAQRAQRRAPRTAPAGQSTGPSR